MKSVVGSMVVLEYLLNAFLVYFVDSLEVAENRLNTLCVLLLDDSAADSVVALVVSACEVAEEMDAAECLLNTLRVFFDDVCSVALGVVLIIAGCEVEDSEEVIVFAVLVSFFEVSDEIDVLIEVD